MLAATSLRRSATGCVTGLGFEFGHALFEGFQTRTGALQHFALRIEFIAAGEIELSKIGAQHGPEVVLQILAQGSSTGCEPRRQALHQATEQFFYPGYLH